MLRLLCLLSSLFLLLPGATIDPPSSSTQPPTLLVANKDGDSLYFVNPSSLTVEDSVAVGRGPHEVAAAPNVQRAYVANYEGPGTISVIDVEAQEEVERWELDDYSRPHGIEVGPAEERLYVTAEANQAVIEIDASTGEILREFSTGQDVTHMLALTSDGNSLFATSIGSGTASKVDLSAGQVVTHTQTGEGAEGVAVAPDDKTVWVTNRADDTVSVLNADSAEVVDSFSAEGFPIRVAFSPEGSTALVSCARAGEVALYDAQSQALQTRLDVGAMPIGVLVHPDGARAFVGSARANTVSVVDLEAQEITDTIPAGKGPDGMAFVPGS